MRCVVFAVQIPFSHCRSWWTAGFQEHWTRSFRLCSSAPCCSSGSVSITASGFRWVHGCTFTLMVSPLFLLLALFFLPWSVHLLPPPPTGWEEMSHVLPAKADHCWSSVALSSYTGYMANVSPTSLIWETRLLMWVTNVLKDVLYFSKCTGLMNFKTLPISIKWT